MIQIGTWYYPSDAGIRTKTLREAEVGYRMGRTGRLRKVCRAWRTAVDIGAFVGTVTTELAGLFERVVAYEPDPLSFEALLMNTRPLKNVVVKNTACGTVNGLVHFSVGAKGRIGSQAGGASVDGDVPCVRLDDEQLKNVDLLKIHTNGAELEVLKGARELIISARPAIWLVQKRMNAAQMTSLAYLRELGYRVVDLEKPDYFLSTVRSDVR
jgi:FkbM family methyltransferase